MKRRLVFVMLLVLAAPSSYGEGTGALAQTYWSLLPVQRLVVPQENFGAGKYRNPIDAFIAAKLPAQKLKPSPEADRRTLLRRLYFALIGLPPTPEEGKSFLTDKTRDAFAERVEQTFGRER